MALAGRSGEGLAAGADGWWFLNAKEPGTVIPIHRHRALSEMMVYSGVTGRLAGVRDAGEIQGIGPAAGSGWIPPGRIGCWWHFLAREIHLDRTLVAFGRISPGGVARLVGMAGAVAGAPFDGTEGNGVPSVFPEGGFAGGGGERVALAGRSDEGLAAGEDEWCSLNAVELGTVIPIHRHRALFEMMINICLFFLLILYTFVAQNYALGQV